MNVFRTLDQGLERYRRLLDMRSDPTALPTGSLTLVREQRVTPVLGLDNFADAFEQLPQQPREQARAQARLGSQAVRRVHVPAETSAPYQPGLSAASAQQLAQLQRSRQRDAFEAGRKAPVNLSGYGASAVRTSVGLRPSVDLGSNAFFASVADLPLRHA